MCKDEPREWHFATEYIKYCSEAVAELDAKTNELEASFKTFAKDFDAASNCQNRLSALKKQDPSLFTKAIHELILLYAPAATKLKDELGKIRRMRASLLSPAPAPKSRRTKV